MQTKEIVKTLPASILKGAAANLAIQALGKNLNKKTFLPTLLVGAVGGGLSCLSDDKYLSTLIAASVFGGGNALANKASFPRTMLKYAAIGTAGRLMLNIPAAVGKINGDWKTEWQMQLPNGALKRYEQEKPLWGCTQAVLKSIAKYFGKTIVSEGEDGSGYDFFELAVMNGFDVTTLSKGDLSTEPYNNIDHFYLVVGGYLKRGWPIAATYFNGELQHTVGVWRISKKRNTDKPESVRYQIDIIDPAQGDPSKVLSQYDFEHAVIRAVKPY